MVYAVIDTNVLVSAFLTRNPNSATTSGNGHKNATEMHDVAKLFAYVIYFYYLCSRKGY